MVKWIAFLVLVLFVLTNPNRVLGQEPAGTGGVAVNVELADSQAGTGDIVSITKDGLVRSTTEYDVGIFGVVVEAPVLSTGPKGDNTKAVISTGETLVKVSAADGAIEVGDFITSSAQAGVGKKATQAGYVLGKALEAYNNTGEVGAIKVAIAIGYSSAGLAPNAVASNILENVNKAIGNPENFNELLRGLVAAIVVILTIIGALIGFIRFITKGLEAIGRNPMARRTIIGGMVLSGAVILILSGLGLGLAFAIMRIGR